MRAIDNHRMFLSIKYGRPETAMKPFEGILTDEQIKNVIAFIRHTFIEKKDRNIQYHSPENRWEDFEKKQAQPIRYFLYDGAEKPLPEELVTGKKIFESTCISCHLVKSRPASTDKSFFSHTPVADAP